MTISPVTLEAMLTAREKRVKRQLEIINKYNMPLVCLTMNIAGDKKRSGLIDFAFYEGMRRVLSIDTPVFYEIMRAPSGIEGYFVFSKEAEKLKDLCVDLEDRDEVGRLFDMDVLRTDGQKLSRPNLRHCLLCENDAAVCARSRAHGLEAVIERTNAILLEFAADVHADAAKKALLSEVWTTPKPGLVDKNNCGSHSDMTITTFEQSANALWPCFKTFFEIGAEEGLPCQKTVNRLRKRGILAEKEMFLATGGANTHKGAVYTLGALLAGRGMALSRGGDFFEHASALSRCDLSEEYRRAEENPLTHGDYAYMHYGARGIRGEAEDGFPAARRAHAQLKFYEACGYSQNDAGVLTLLRVLSELQDTNLLHRGGQAGLAYAQHRAHEVNALPEKERVEAARGLDEDFIERNLSPGGCADVLAAAYFLCELESLEFAHEG
jgi:holo-ACP synthase/triphosphoribosyl-dephospho-CoA synthase